MFIEKLWEKNPELVIDEIKNIFNVKEERGDSLHFVGAGNGALRFSKNGHHTFTIFVRDFEVFGCKADSKRNIEWIQFMHKVCGDRYVYYYISHRNKELDKLVEEFKNKYNNQTRNVLVEVGFEEKLPPPKDELYL